MPDDETVAPIAPPEPTDAPEDNGAGSETTLASVDPAEAPEQHQAEAETTSAASTEVVDTAPPKQHPPEPVTTSIASAETVDPPAKAAPAIVQDQWTQMAKGIQETLARDLEKIKRLDELLSRPIFLTPHVVPPDHPSLD
jgi:hypothetical protein